MEIQKAIKELRKQYNMSQSDLADALGVSNVTVSNWENGKSVPRYQHIAKMAEMSPDDSCFRDDDAASMSDIIVKLFDMSDDDLDIIIITAKQIKRSRNNGTDK